MSTSLLTELSTAPTAFAALMPLINPFGTALIILGMVGNQPAEVYRKLALKIAVLMIVFVAFLELVGQWVLHFFGISLPVLQVGGGLTLAAMGWNTLTSGGPAADKTTGAGNESELLDGAFYPFTFPLTVGPGAIVVLLTLSAHASRPTLIETTFAHLGIMLGVVLLAVLVYFCYRYAPWLAKRLPQSAINGIQQLLAFTLLCIGVQIAWGGVSALVKTL